MIKTETIKKIRVATGAGIVDVQKALEESGGDETRAVEILRKQGQKIMAKKQSREAGEGLIEAYVHAGGKVGVLLNLGCETDFVARNDEFKELAHDVAMQIAATDPDYVTEADIPGEVLEKEKEIYLAELKASNKPTEILDKIVEGKLQKFYEQVCLLHQPFIKDDSKKINDLVTEKTAKLGEKIEIREFMRYEI
jgi:elongation factor Ts